MLNAIMISQIIRQLTCYSILNEELILETKISDFNLEAFQIEFGVDKCNPMFDSYKINADNLKFILQQVEVANTIDWDFDLFSYYIETLGE